MGEYQEVEIRTETIKLGQFLKWINLTFSGGEAKQLIEDGLIKVNGEVEIRRGRKLKAGDVIEISDYDTFKIVIKGR